MIKKSKEIIDFIKLVNITFGSLAPVINDHWEGDLYAIGLQKDNKLIYVAFYNKNDYFYECELLTNDSGNSYVVQESNNATEEELLTIISKFFKIPQKRFELKLKKQHK